MLNGLYVLTDNRYYPHKEWPARIEKIILAGANTIQLREKSLCTEAILPLALEIRQICNNYGALFIVNDDAQLAKSINADGVHIGKDDCSLQHARDYLGNKYIIGVSCYNNIRSANIAQSRGADYVAFGSVFPSLTKVTAQRCSLSIISQAKQCLSIPLCAIGGIKQQNVAHVLNAGADIIATSHAVFNADDPGQAANNIYQQVILSR